MNLRLCIGMLLLSALLCVAAESGARPRPEQWNIRIAPSLDAPVVASVKRGTALKILGRRGDWYEVPAPSDAEVWVSSGFVSADGSLKPAARLRSGPGVIYPEYRYNRPETPVKIEERESGYGNGWLRIASLPGIRCYIHKKFTGEIPLPEQPPEKPSEAVKRVRRDRYTITMEGVPVRLAHPVEDASHELILEINGKKIPICYLVSPHLNLSLWENRMVRIAGRHRWIKGISRPFLEIEKVSPSWR